MFLSWNLFEEDIIKTRSVEDVLSKFGVEAKDFTQRNELPLSGNERVYTSVNRVCF